MQQNNYPVPHTHTTFNFGSVTIDSNFDSGNCCNVVKVSNNSFQIWIGIDHPNNKYRTWFHFSAGGFPKGFTVTFKIKNQQNQSRLLSEGLVPVFREESSDQWKRIKQRINLSAIEYNEGWIEWPFKHTFTAAEKTYFAFFYPWSNVDNANFLNSLGEKTKDMENIYFHRTTICRSLEGRPIQFVTISSKKGIIGKQEKIEDKNLFEKGRRPALFADYKKGIVIGARVHPGEVPGSHVMTGMLKELTEDNEIASALRDNFVFYIFPIFNPDGVGRGHYRVDTNGINLNRCYINPSIKKQPSIYAVRKIIMHLHEKNKFFAFLDLHAHAARKGTFIYGNWSNELKKQVDSCLFPKIVSMNSIDFQYEGSNFTERNMNCKDRGDHMSKEGSGRVAMYKATKNINCWTLECNYNISKLHNILESKLLPGDIPQKPTQDTLDFNLITTYKYPNQKQPKEFFTIETYHKLGKEICESFLDLIQMNPQSRIDNPKNHFKSIQNLKMNLGIALLRMDSGRFESQYKKIYNGLFNTENKEITERALKGLYYLLIKNAKIQNINMFLKEGNKNVVIFESPKKTKSLPPTKQALTNSSIFSGRNSSAKKEQSQSSSPVRRKMINSEKFTSRKPITLNAIRDVDLYKSTGSLESDDSSVSPIKMVNEDKISYLLEEKLQMYHQEQQKRDACSKINLKLEEFPYGKTKQFFSDSFSTRITSGMRTNNRRFKIEELPSLSKKNSSNLVKIETNLIPFRKGASLKDETVFSAL